MRMKKGLLVLAAATLPLASVVLLGGGTAVAKTSKGTGTVNCNIGGSITFSPPLSSAGTPGVKKTVTTVTASLASCSGGTPAAAPSSTVVKPIKAKVAKGTNASTCSGFDASASSITVKAKQTWTDAKPTKFDVSNLSIVGNDEGELGFSGSFTASGSYAGSGHLTVYLTAASSNQIATCSGTISSAQLDRATSTVGV